MKRFLLPCLLFVFGIALVCPDAWAQNKPSRTPPSLPPPTKTVYETLAAQKDLSKFAGMVDEAGLKGMLSGSPDEPVTVFAPSNAALGNLSSAASKKIEDNKTNLQNFVKYHIITGSLVTSSAIKGRKASPASADGETLEFDGTNKNNPPKIGDATLEKADILATNGVIHVVSTALVPPSLGGTSKMQVMTPPTAPPPPPPAAATAPTAPAPPVAASSAKIKPMLTTTTAGTPESSTTNGTPMDQTTSVAPSSETTTGAVPEVTPDQPAQQPVPAPTTGSDSGNTSIWKKMGW